MIGQITKIVRDIHTVSYGTIHYDCKCRGKIRNLRQVPVVGDYCEFNPDKLIIEKILPRKNEFTRPNVSNIDQLIIVTSVVEPDFSTNLLDKFLVTANISQIEAIICLTKEDLASPLQLSAIKDTMKYYQKIGYKVISNQNLEIIKVNLQNKTTVFTGQTGVGKSSLLNKLYSNLSLPTGEISLALGRGKHTTRVISLFDVNGGKVLDTPGFSSLDFNNISREDIKNSFREFQQFNCPFKDCTHTKEIDCNVKKAVADNKILKSRYENYLKFIERRK